MFMKPSPFVILPAAGSQSRWGAYPDVNKLLLPVHGEPLLLRTRSQLFRRGVSYCLIEKNEASSPLPGTGLGNSVPHWKCDRRNTVLFADVAWSDAALDRVLECEAGGVFWFGRAEENRHGRNREIFGLSFDPAAQDMLLHAIRVWAAMRLEGNEAGGWPVYQILSGRRPDSNIVKENFMEIDDETSDFDTPGDYRQWRKLFEKRG